MIRYYGRHYSYVSKRKQKKEVKDEIILCIIEEYGASSEKKKARARLMQNIY